MNTILTYDTKVRMRARGDIELTVPSILRKHFTKDEPVTIQIIQDSKPQPVDNSLDTHMDKLSDDFKKKQDEAIKYLQSEGESSQYELAYKLQLNIKSVHKLMNRIKILTDTINIRFDNDIRYYSIKCK